MTMEQILTAYNARMMLGAGIERLLASGQIVEKDGRYFVGKPIMFYLAKGLMLMKILLLKGRSESDSAASSVRRM
mgnify:CR=1 FL=1